MAEPARLLLDTHALLWSLAAPERLLPATRDAIQHPDTVVIVSVASAWEMAIKAALGKLVTPGDLPEQLRANRFDVLDVRLAHALAVETLPPLHRDPFDRLLVVQARLEGLHLVTRDPQVRQYDVAVLPA